MYPIYVNSYYISKCFKLVSLTEGYFCGRATVLMLAHPYAGYRYCCFGCRRIKTLIAVNANKPGSNIFDPSHPILFHRSQSLHPLVGKHVYVSVRPYSHSSRKDVSIALVCVQRFNSLIPHTLLHCHAVSH